MRTTSTDHPRMQSEVVGTGAPLVLIGGGLTGAASWAPHAERLAPTRRVARLQLLGVQYGLEDRPLPEGYSVRMESRALAAALDHLDWTGAVDLVAWSYGAVITLDFALNHPERVRTLTLIEPPAVWVAPDRLETDTEVLELRQLGRDVVADVDASHLERFLRTAALAPPGVEPSELPQWPTWYEHRRSLRVSTAPLDHRDDPARLRAFDRPVLLVTGTGTSDFFRHVQRTLEAELPRVSTLELPGGHAPQIVSFEPFLDAVERFQAEAVLGDSNPTGASGSASYTGEVPAHSGTADGSGVRPVAYPGGS
jgi:pimeloyl-ACP methyl ester carboxylesterase